MPTEVIATVHQLENACKKYKGIVFTDKEGNIITNDNNDHEHEAYAVDITGVDENEKDENAEENAKYDVTENAEDDFTTEENVENDDSTHENDTGVLVNDLAEEENNNITGVHRSSSITRVHGNSNITGMHRFRKKVCFVIN